MSHNSNKSWDFGSDLEYHPDPGIFLTEVLPLMDTGGQEFCEISCFGGGLRSPSAFSFAG